MNVAIAIDRSIRIPAPYERVQPLLHDLETTIRRFPKLRRLKKLDENAYLWEMAPIGSRLARIAHEVRYAARYHIDAARGRLHWTPLAGHGNATIEGAFELEDQRAATKLAFRVKGELREVPVPFVYRLVAPAFIQGKFTRLVDVFLENTAAAVGLSRGEIEAARHAA